MVTTFQSNVRISSKFAHFIMIRALPTIVNSTDSWQAVQSRLCGPHTVLVQCSAPELGCRAMWQHSSTELYHEALPQSSGTMLWPRPLMQSYVTELSHRALPRLEPCPQSSATARALPTELCHQCCSPESSPTLASSLYSTLPAYCFLTEKCKWLQTVPRPLAVWLCSVFLLLSALDAIKRPINMYGNMTTRTSEPQGRQFSCP